MRKSLFFIILIVLSYIVYAEGNQEYKITETLLIDDFEDGDVTSKMGILWWAFDVKNGGELVDKEIKIVSEPGPDGSHKILFMDWKLPYGLIFTGLSIDFKEDQQVIDLSDYFGIRFYAKGKGKCDVRIETSESVKNSEYNHMRYQLILSDEWTIYEIPFTKFRHPGWGKNYSLDTSKTVGFEWGLDLQLHGKKCSFYLDNVELYKAEIVEKTTDTDKIEKDKDPGKDKDTQLKQDRLDLVKNKRVAIVGVDSGEIDKSVSKAIIDFVINAFVNESTMKVVDRNSIEKILNEQEFQMMDFADTEKVIEIGKLAGAEFIVTGSISKVADTFYLNIKLISVQTAEILGSSITTADNENAFFNMCNTAVKNLFQ